MAAARVAGCVISFGARPGATTRAGCGSNVMAAARQPELRAIATTRRRISPMSGMHAIEIADGERAGAEVRRGYLPGARGFRKSGDIDFQAVVGETDAVRQAALGFGMRQVVRDVGEECLLRARERGWIGWKFRPSSG